MKKSVFRGSLWLLLMALFISSGVAAATLDLLIDRDNNSASGCTVNTPGGAFAGVEQIFTTTIDTTVFPAKISGITRTDCSAPPSTFSAPFTVVAGGWPVGVGTGTNGFDVVESYITLNQLFGQYRIGVVYNDPNTGNDTLLNVNGQAGGAPILLVVGPTPVIPTLTHGALLLLMFGLGWLALRQLRKHKASTLLIIGVLGSIVAGTALAAVVLDGMINDWAGVPPAATDPQGDAAGGADIAALFVQVDTANGRMYVRLDVKIASPAQITSTNSTTFTAGSAGNFGITTFGIPPVNSILQSGTLPAGVNFTYTAGQSTATLAGTPGANTGGTYPLVFTAKNGVPPDATQSFTLTVNQAPAVTSVDNTAFIVGTPGTFTFTASGFPKPTITLTGCAPALPGGLTVTDNGNGTATLAGAAALGSVGLSNCSVTATNGIGAAATQPFALTVNKAPTTTAVTSSNNPSVVGQPVTFTATVIATPPGSGIPAGSVQFKDGAANLGAPVPLAGTGKATLSTSALTLGPHNITADYVGDGNFSISTGSLPTQTVNKAASTSTLASSVNPSVFGQSVTFTATVAATPPGVGTPTGTVQFKNGAANLGAPVALVAGSAAFTTPTLSVGAHAITFDYSGDASFGISSGSLPTQTVNKAATTTAVSSSVNPSMFGQSTTLTAVVTPTAPGAGAPTGTVQFMDGATPIGAPVALNGAATATLAIATLSAGSHAVTAVYSGDSNFSVSTGSLPTQTVNKTNTTTMLTSGTNPSVIGSPVTFTATISAVAPGAGIPTGTVTFLDGATTLGTSTLAGGVATLTTSSLTPGSHPNINTTYAGDSNFNGSNGGPLDQVVNAGPAAVADPNYATLHDAPLVVPAATGLLPNDTLGTPAATISDVSGTACPPYPCTHATAQGGSVSVLGDGSFTFTPKSLFAGNDTFTYTLTNANGSSTATATVDVQDAAPVIDLNGSAPAGNDFGPVTFTEPGPAVAIVGNALPNNALTITDNDSGNIGSATVTLTNAQDIGAETLGYTCPMGPAPACSGAIQTTDIVASVPGATHTLTITRIAARADYEALLRSLTYDNASANPTPGGNRTITFRVDDQIKDSAPLAVSTVQVVGVNNTPVITAPVAATTPKDTVLAFTGGNVVSVADADAGSGALAVTLAATNGTVSTTGSTMGLTTSGLGTATATLIGPLSNLNVALAALQYAPTTGFTGAAALKIDIDDQGNSGTGGPKTATNTINITVDTPPSIVSTDPTQNATVPTTKVITFTFSEPVTVNGNSFALECPAGVPYPFTLSPAGPATVYTLTPTGGLTAGATCTASAFQNSIFDSAGQPLTGGLAISFTVNTFPTVQLPTTPANGATGVVPGTNIVINFSETVTAGATAFKLECPAGTPVTFGQTASPASSYTLTPGALLPTGVACTVTVVAAQITDSLGQNMAADHVFTFTVGTPPAFTSVNSTIFTVGTPGTYLIAASGSPAPTISQSPGSCAPLLPAGVSFSGNLTLSGTPPAGSGGTYVCPLTAANGIAPNATQSFTLTINEVPTAVNDPTLAASPHYTTPHDTLLTVAVANGILANDNRGFPLAGINKVQGTVCGAFPCVQPTAQLGSVSVNGNGSFTFQPKSGFAGSDTFTYTLINAVGESNTATVTLTVTNALPVVDLDGAAGATIGYAATFTEGPGAASIVDAANLTVTDTDSANLASATVVITNLLDGASESLAVTLAAPFIAADVVYTPGTGTLQITRSATLAQYQTLLRTLTYSNASLNPTTTTRDITVEIDDGIGDNNPLAHSMVTVVAVNNAPTVAAPAGPLTTPFNTDLTFAGNVSVNDVDAGTAGVKVTLTATNGTITLNGSAGLVVTGDGTASVVSTGALSAQNAALNGMKFKPTTGYSGGATLKIDIDDLGNTGTPGALTGTATVNITVSPANATPVAVAQSGLTTNEDTLKLITLTGTDSDNLALTFAVGAAPANGGLSAIGAPSCVPNGGGGTTCTATVTYTPNANYSGPDSFTFTVNDGGVTSAPGLVSLTVDPVNDPPSFTIAGNPPAVDEDSAAQTVSNFVTSISPGPADESGQTVSFNVTGNNNAALFSAGPALSPTGTLTYTPAANANGAALITVTLSDNGSNVAPNSNTSGSQSFTITVNAVNDPPSFTIAGSPPAVNEDAGAQTVNGFATAISPGPNEAGQTVSFNITGNTNAGLFSAGPALSPTGVLTYTPAANQNGSATITVTLSDNASNVAPNSNTSGPQGFVITVNPVNDPPVANGFVNLPAQAGIPIAYPVAKLGGSDPVEGTTVTINTIPTNVTNGSVAINVDGSFTFTPLPSAAGGTASFQYKVTDTGIPGPGVDSALATVSFQVAGPAIYFVKNVAVGTGNCTLGNECTLQTALTTIGAAVNAYIYLGDANSHTNAGAISLNVGGSIIGQGITQPFDTFFGISAPAEGMLAARPTTSQPFPTVTKQINLNSNSKVHAFNVSVTGAESGIQSSVRTGLTVALGTVQTNNGTATTTHAINLSSSSGAFSFGNVTAAGTGSGSNGVLFNTTTSASTVTFGNITTAAGTAFDTQSPGGTVFSIGAVNATGGKGVNISSSSGNFTFTSVTSSGGTNNISLSNTGASISLGNGSLTGATSDSFVSNGGNASITYGGNITSGNAHSVNISNKTGGTVGFSGTVTDNDTGILLTNNASTTINFTNTLTLNTVGGATAFSASGGGTVSVSGANSTINSGIGRAVNIDGTNSGGVTFRSVSASGGTATAIFLKNAGTGGFTITGTNSDAGSGGTISAIGGADVGSIKGAATTGTGVYMDTVSNVSLSNMIFGANLGTMNNYGIRGDAVTNFTLRDSEFRGTFGTNAAHAEGTIRFGSKPNSDVDPSAGVTGLTGTALFEGNSIGGGAEDNLSVHLFGANTLSMTVRDNPTSGDPAIFSNTVQNGNDALHVTSGNTTNVTLTVTGVDFNGARGDQIHTDVSGTSTHTLVIQNNNFINAHTNQISGGGGLSIIAGGATSQNYSLDYYIDGNVFKGTRASAIFSSAGGVSGTVSGLVTNNQLGTANGAYDTSLANRGSMEGMFFFGGIDAKETGSTGNINYALKIDGNTIRDVNGVAGILLRSNQKTSGGQARVEATISNNTVAEMGPNIAGGIYLQPGGASLNDDKGAMGVNISNNNINFSIGGASASGDAVVFDQASTIATFYMPGYTSAPSANANTLASFLTGPKGNVFTNAAVSGSNGVLSNTSAVQNQAFILSVPVP